MAMDVRIKLWDYWCPYMLVFPAGYFLSLLYARGPRPLVLFASLALIIYPWSPKPTAADFDSIEHSVAEHWMFNLHTASVGYWIWNADPRWIMSRDQRKLLDVLRNEIAAGRIVPATHVLHIAQTSNVWYLNKYASFTGINDDPIVVAFNPKNPYEAGGRVRGIGDLNQIMANTPPPYVLEELPAAAWDGATPPGYELIFDGGHLRLYRRAAQGAGASP